MITPITALTKEDVEILRRKPHGTNNKHISVSTKEVLDMQKHLQTLFTGGIQRNFAEKMCLRNKEY